MEQSFVLGASVTIRWALQDGSEADRIYADLVLESFNQACAIVPALWYMSPLFRQFNPLGRK
jgi:hypothetical protein